MADNLYDDPDLYDLVAPRDPEMEAFYVRIAGGGAVRVLELACGTGRLTAPVAASGARIVAADLSPVMLDAARTNLGALPNVRYERLDMRDFDLGERFERVMVAANSLLHLTEPGALLSGLRSIARHLEPEGRLIFDVFLPSLPLLTLPAGERQLLGHFDHRTLGAVTIEETIDYDATTQVSTADWYWSRPGHPDFRRTTLSMRQVFPEELVALLELAGLRLLKRSGGFAGEAFGQGFRQVCVAGLR